MNFLKKINPPLYEKVTQIRDQAGGTSGERAEEKAEERNAAQANNEDEDDVKLGGSIEDLKRLCIDQCQDNFSVHFPV